MSSGSDDDNSPVCSDLCDNPDCRNSDPHDFEARTCFSLDPNSEAAIDYILCTRCGQDMDEREWCVRLELQLMAENAFDKEDVDLFTPEYEEQDEEVPPVFGSLDHLVSNEVEPSTPTITMPSLSLTASNSSFASLPFDDAVGDLTHRNLDKVWNVLLQRPCSCGNIDQEQFQSVQDQKGNAIPNLKSCLQCGECVGVDDSMSFYEAGRFLSNCQLTTKPCTKCGNADPDEFLFEESDKGYVTLKCIRNQCNTIMEDEEGAEQDQEPDVDVECGSNAQTLSVQCNCGNRDPEKLLIHMDENDNPYEMECQCCHKKHGLMSCVCGNQDPERFFYHDDENSSLHHVTCLNCYHSFSPRKHNPTEPSKDRKRLSQHCPKEIIKSLRQLRTGDHITWHRFWGYWHHALVVKADHWNSQILVIEYDGPMYEKGSILPKGAIVEHWINSYPRREKLHRVIYAPEETVPVHQVLRNARSRLGERRYNIFTNNCEHFAWSCKTGTGCCTQTLNLKNAVKRIGMKLFGTVAHKGASTGLKVVISNLSKAAAAAAADGAGDVLGAAAAKTSNALPLTAAKISAVGAQAVGMAAIVAIEAGFLIKDIRKAYKMMKERGMSREVFINMVIKRSVHSVAAATGGIVGSIIGSLAIPVPILGSVIGATLGSCLGHILGPFCGRQLISLKDKVVEWKRRKRRNRRHRWQQLER